MKKTIAKSMTAIMAAAMIAGSLTACGGSDNKDETTAAVETTVETPEAVEETTAEAADVEESTEAADAEESTEAADAEESTEAADAEESSEADATEASKEEAAGEANAEAAEETTEAAQN